MTCTDDAQIGDKIHAEEEGVVCCPNVNVNLAIFNSIITSRENFFDHYILSATLLTSHGTPVQLVNGFPLSSWAVARARDIEQQGKEEFLMW